MMVHALSADENLEARMWHFSRHARPDELRARIEDLQRKNHRLDGKLRGLQMRVRDALEG